MDSQNYGFFSNLMQSGSNFEEQYLMESQCFEQDNQVVSQETQSPAYVGPVSKKQQRRANFSIEEDKLLVSAWLNISMDPVQGTDQKKTAFWARVKEFFDKNKPYELNRTEVSLMNRWSTIQGATNKFCGCYAQVESRNQSGSNNEDKNQPKWFLECEKKSQSKQPRNGVAPCPTLNAINLEDDNVPTDNFVDLERPTGIKAEKKNFNQKNNEIQSSTQISGALEKITESRNKLVNKKLEMLEKTYAQEEEKIRIKKVGLQLEEFKEEERIMLLDISNLSEDQQEFYALRKREILEKRRKVQ
ncbi:hypothetical protein Vadar_005261 [Vaccinium darrowii]|uniref:Uncharacterized protein n=1 Tax=Vaccinium darrowii TaxID=229202 RepID=A0ACB7YCU9_9ERIC|nr:hypothetical protein Vadar_005261 [Vaccinium darrowii]